MGAEHCDVYAIYGEPLRTTAERIAEFRARAARFSRTPGFNISFRPIIADTEGKAHVLFDVIVGQILGIVASVGDMEHPFFAVGSPMVGTHRHENRHFANCRAPDPSNQHIRVARKLREIYRDVRRRDLANDTEPFVGDAKHARQCAAAIASEHIARADEVFPTRVVVSNCGSGPRLHRPKTGLTVSKENATRVDLVRPPPHDPR